MLVANNSESLVKERKMENVTSEHGENRGLIYVIMLMLDKTCIQI